MQSLPIYLYINTTDITLDLDSTTSGVNRIMYQRELEIQKGIKNVVRIQFKNSDQKRVPVSSTSTFVFSMFDILEQRLLIEKKLDILDDGTLTTRGLAELTFTESDTLDLQESSYKFSVKQMSSDGTYVPTYSNTYYGISGVIKIKGDAFAKLVPSQEIVSFNRRSNSEIMKFEHVSGSVYAYPEFNSNSALHTMALYMTNFKGTVYVQGTLSNSASSHYSTIESRLYTGFTGIDYVNFNGVYSYVRVYYVPATAPAESMNDNPNYFGSFDKVLYRS